MTNPSSERAGSMSETIGHKVSVSPLLPGVSVTAKSPALMGVRTVVTEGDGKYSIAPLPSGEYELTYELST